MARAEVADIRPRCGKAGNQRWRSSGERKWALHGVGRREGTAARGVAFVKEGACIVTLLQENKH